MRNIELMVRNTDTDWRKGQSSWHVHLFDLDKVGISYRTKRDILIIVGRDDEHFPGQVFQVSPRDRSELVLAMMDAESDRLKDSVDSAENVSTVLSMTRMMEK